MASVNKVILTEISARPRTSVLRTPVLRLPKFRSQQAAISTGTTNELKRRRGIPSPSGTSLLKLLSSTPVKAQVCTSRVDLKLINGRIKTAKTVTQQKSSPRASSSWTNESDS